MSIIRLKTCFLLKTLEWGSCCRPQANDKADTSGDFYSFSMHDSDSGVADSGCKVEALQFLNDLSHKLEQLRKSPSSVCHVQHQCSIISSCRETVQPSWTHTDTSQKWAVGRINCKKKTRRLRSNNISDFLWQLTLMMIMMMMTLLSDNFVLLCDTWHFYVCT